MLMLLFFCLANEQYKDSSVTDSNTFLMVRNSKPESTIVIAKEPTSSARLSALELQYHIHKITGIMLPIVTDNTKVDGRRILVGESAMTRELGIKGSDFKSQEYLIRITPDTIVLIGQDWQETEENLKEAGISTVYSNIGDSRIKLDYGKITGTESKNIILPGLFDDQGTCYAVYDFLERFCSIRWYGPTELGMVHPTMQTLSFESKEIYRSPAFAHREGSMITPWPILQELWNNPSSEECYLYMRRLRTGGDKWAGNHSFRSYYDRFLRKSLEHPELFEGEHPEYFAQGRSDGERQFCYTNPDFIKQVAQDARDFFDGKGIKGFAPAMGDYFAVVPMDNNTWCLCPDCQAELEKDKQSSGPHFSNGRASGYMFGFVNKVAKELKKTHPDKYISALAYWDYACYPERIQLESNVAVAPCLQTRIYWGPNIVRNDIKFYKRWVEGKDHPIYLWLYYCFPEENALVGGYHCFPGFMAHTASRQIKMYHEDGVKGLFLCGIGEQVDFYITMKLLDDPELDIDEILDEFFTSYYGASAEPMKKLYLRIEDIYSNPENYPPEVRTEE
ncbi:MAG: hypothetical protein QG588_1743, partial [Candidatus Poribacteria bacterium]|nr:hypothetical protein [Candidatus Poribacteria bacterium]